MSQFLTVPVYVADPTNGEVVTGYQVQSAAPVVGLTPLPPSGWADITGSPFASNVNIFDPTGVAATLYRVRPIRQATVSSVVYTLDTPFTKAFTVGTPLYEAAFTLALLPSLRFTYLNDNGVAQTNGTDLLQTTGSGLGVWSFDGTTTRFPLQYVMNDDPIHVLDGVFEMQYQTGGNTPVQMLPDEDYSVDVRAGFVNFKTAPASDDTCTFNFRRVDFINEDLLLALRGALGLLSSFGLGGYELTRTGQQGGPGGLYGFNKALANNDLVELLCKATMFSMREGQTEAAMRGAMSFRDGAIGADPMPNRALEFLVQKLDVTEKSLRRGVNAYVRTVTLPTSRGEFEIFWDMSSMTPFSSSMFGQIPYGTFGVYAGVFNPWYL